VRMTGTYVLILRALSEQSIRIGKLGVFSFPKGFYAYVGSAFGPGGLVARLRHHLQSTSSPHWHIDYLRRRADIDEVWVTTKPAKLEHEWAKGFCEMRGVTVAVSGFGASDCGCHAHLFKFENRPSFEHFRDQVWQGGTTPALKRIKPGQETLAADISGVNPCAPL
ncbi:MAG: DUF123 domain-containing protein, partial [bacterium]